MWWTYIFPAAAGRGRLLGRVLYRFGNENDRTASNPLLTTRHQPFFLVMHATMTLLAPAATLTLSADSPSSLAAASVLGLVPRAPKLPSDIETLVSVDPMSATLAAIGGLEYVARARANVIRGMIAECLLAA